MRKATLTLLVIVLWSFLFLACTKSDNDDDDNENLPTVSFTVTGAVTDNVSYNNTTSHSLQGAQGNGVLTMGGMGPGYSLSLTVTANNVTEGDYNATQGQYINNSSGTKTFGELTSGSISIDSVDEISVGVGTAYLIAGSFMASITDAGGGGSVQIQGTFSNVYVGQ